MLLLLVILLTSAACLTQSPIVSNTQPATAGEQTQEFQSPLNQLITDWLAGTPSIGCQMNLKHLKTRVPYIKNYWKSKSNKTFVLAILLLVLSGDIQTNPGPRQETIYPCGYCELKVGWSTMALCCDNCDIWYHKNCLEMSSGEYNLLGRSNISWICRKCDSINVDSFTYHSYILDLGNSYQVLSNTKSTIETPNSELQFVPRFFSSPQYANNSNSVCRCNISEPDRRKSYKCTKECCRRNLQPQNVTHPGVCCRCNLPTQASLSLSVPKINITTKSTRAKGDTHSGIESESHHSRSTTKTNTHDSTDSSTSRLVPEKSNNWRTLVVNCHSIKANSSSLSTAVDYIKPDCIIGTESWLNSETYNSEVMPDGYITYRKDRDDGYGGSFIAIKNTYNSSIVQSQGTHSEIVWAEVELKQATNVYVGAYYRAPSSPIESMYDLQDSLLNLPNNAKSKNITLGGDFNTPDIDWEIPAVKEGASNKNTQEELISVTIQHELKQIQDKPTRGNSILDLLFTNNPSLIKYTDVIPGISDHEMVIVDQDLRPIYNKQKRRKIFKFKQADWEAIRTQASELSTDVTDNINIRSINDSWNTFKNGIMKIMDSLVPSKLTSSRFNLPWLNRNVKKNIKKKHKLWAKAKRSNTNEAWEKYRKHKRLTQKATRAAHLNYINNILEESFNNKDTKPFWHYIKSKKQDNIGVSPLKHQGTLHANSKDKAELLNTQFQSVFTREDDSTTPMMSGPSFPSILDIDITTQGVRKLLQNLKINKASGPDGIPNRILKETAQQIAPALTAIFQYSLNHGVVPDDWCEANVAPVYKKGSRHQAVNYRPVSLTCVCCKIMEHIICKHIMNHLEQYDILTSLQHGFRHGHSCETQLLLTLHDMTQLYDKKHQIDVAILDFSKAFDTVPHRKLLHKLHHYGVKGNILKWIESFLTNRTQRVLVEGEFSKSVKVLSGVPQGTVLGPLLFLCFINDLPNEVISQVRLFADDCLLYRPIKSAEDHIILQQDLTKLETWANTWGMKFNAQKCYVLRICRSKKQSEYFYNLNDHILEHVNKTSRKANSILAFLRRNLKENPYLGVLISEDS